MKRKPVHRLTVTTTRKRTVLSMLNSVGPYQNIMYIGIFAWGVAAALGAEPNTALFDKMPITTYTLWIILHIMIPLVLWLGQGLRTYQTSPTRTTMGWWLQWAADSSLAVMSATYVVALTRYGVTEPSINFAILALVAFVLACRDLLNIAVHEGLCETKVSDVD
jgi:hypothetical protein